MNVHRLTAAWLLLLLPFSLNLLLLLSLVKGAGDGRNDTTVYCEIVSSDDGDFTKSAERRLMDYLFGTKNEPKYLSGVRPKRNSRLPVDVSVQLSLLSINSLDDKNQELSTTGYMMMEWTDEFLIWNPTDFDNLTNVVVQPELIWLPSDIGIENSVDAIYQTSFRTEFRAIVDYEGKVTWTPGGRISTACKLDVTFYPYDSQSCVISLSSWAYSDKHVHLTTSADRIDLKDYNPNGEWHITGTSAKSGVRFYGEPYSFVMFEIKIQRKFYYHLINILLPTTLLSGLILLVFKLPAESGEKTGLGITILLSFSVFLLMIAESLPKTSDSLPIIGFYLTFLLVASSSSLLLTVVSLDMHHASGEKIVPQHTRRILRILSFITLTRFPRFSHCNRHCKSAEAMIDAPPPRSTSFNRRSASYMGSGSSNGTLVGAANLSFETPTAKTPERKRIITAQAYRSPYLVNYTTCPASPAANRSSTPDQKRKLHDALLASQVTRSFLNSNAPPLPERGVVASEMSKMQDSLSAYIDELSWKMKKAEVQEEIKKDWKECSLCVDRIAFRFFSIVVGAISIIMCIGLPLFRELNVSQRW